MKDKGMTSAISSLVHEDMENMSLVSGGGSFVWKMRVVYFSVKHFYLCNKKRLLKCALSFLSNIWTRFIKKVSIAL